METGAPKPSVKTSDTGWNIDQVHVQDKVRDAYQGVERLSSTRRWRTQAYEKELL